MWSPAFALMAFFNKTMDQFSSRWQSELSTNITADLQSTLEITAG